MNGVEIVRLVRAAVLAGLQGISLRILALAFAVGLVVLIGYCLGHGLFAGEPLDPVASLRWSLAHATGIGLIAAVGYYLRERHWLMRAVISFAAGIAGLVSLGMLLGAVPLTYISGVGYLLLSLAGAVLLAPAIEHAWLEVDFGRSRKLVPARRILAVHGARNYLEVEVEGADAVGLVRMTMEEMVCRFPRLLIRAHRSHLVNPGLVSELKIGPRGGLILLMANGNEVPVTARYADGVQVMVASVPSADSSSHAASEEC